MVGSVVAEGARQRRSSWRRRDGARVAEPDSSRDYQTRKKPHLSCTNVDILLFGAKADDEVAPPPRAVPGQVGLSGSWRCEGTGNR